MKRYFLIFGIVVLAGLSLYAGNTTANHWGFSNIDLWGGYAYQLTGTICFPEGTPLAVMNGPFAANGRMFFDGDGRARLQNISNFNGQIAPGDIDGTYKVNRDGTYQLVLSLLLNGIPATVTYQGVIVDDGKETRFIQSGFSVTGVPLPDGYIGSVVVGSLIKQ
jgi:hypothetical protein